MCVPLLVHRFFSSLLRVNLSRLYAALIRNSDDSATAVVIDIVSLFSGQDIHLELAVKKTRLFDVNARTSFVT